MSDENLVFARVAKSFRKHSTVNHGDGEFARFDIFNNTAESFNSWIERKRDVHFYISKKQMQRYINDVITRWNLREKKEVPMTPGEISKMMKGMTIMEKMAYFGSNNRGEVLTKPEMVRLPLLVRLKAVFAHALGCNVRRDRKTDGIVVL